MNLTTVEENAHRTAITRRKASVPTRWVIENLHAPQGRVLDFGCGRGKDVEALRERGFDVEGYDPHWQPGKPIGPFGLITCNYVLNVLPDLASRIDTLREIHSLSDGGRVFVSARSHREIEKKRKPTWVKTGDGWVTSTGTFQHGLDLRELALLMWSAGFERSEIWRKGDTVYALSPPNLTDEAS